MKKILVLTDRSLQKNLEYISRLLARKYAGYTLETIDSLNKKDVFEFILIILSDSFSEQDLSVLRIQSEKYTADITNIHYIAFKTLKENKTITQKRGERKQKTSRQQCQINISVTLLNNKN